MFFFTLSAEQLLAIAKFERSTFILARKEESISISISTGT